MDEKYPQEILAAANRIKPYVWRTPLMFSSYLSDPECNCNVYIKLESEQVTGSFKVRGAFNKLMRIKEDVNDVSTIKAYTASSGNHGLACLYACKTLNIPLTIYCREDMDPEKKEILLHEKANLCLHGTDCLHAELKARSEAQARGGVYVPPYNDPDTVAGQGTIGIEILESLPNVDAVLIPVGGGGLIAGIARYIKQVKPSTKIYGCQPKNSKVMYESIKAKKIIWEESLPTLADATAGGIEEHAVTFELCRDYVDDWILVEEEDIAKGVVFMMNKHHKIVEGAAGLAVGAFMSNKENFAGQNVVIVSCGGNISSKVLVELLKKH